MMINLKYVVDYFTIQKYNDDIPIKVNHTTIASTRWTTPKNEQVNPPRRAERTEKMTINERRYLLSPDVRAVCIVQNWYDMGTNVEYGAMLHRAGEINNLTKEDLYELAADIYAHTSASAFCGMERADAVCEIMFTLARKSVTTFVLHD